MNRIFIALIIFLYTSISFAMTSQKQSVMQAGNAWAAAINARNAQQITALYDPHAYLYATFQNLLDNQQAIYKYFKKLVAHQNLKVKFIKEHIRLYGETAINSGLYDFSYDENGKHVDVPARYTFVYAETPKGWMIVDHHSSVLPER